METFIQEMRRYLGFTPEDDWILRRLGPRMEKYLPEMAERFYAQIPHHPNAFRVFTGGENQILTLKRTLQEWARGVFSGNYDEAYAEQRYRIGYRHVRLGLEQKYVISAMGIIRAFLSECLVREFSAGDERSQYARSLGKILDLDLNLMCESYMHATFTNLRALYDQVERANHDLAEASRAKDEFLAQISHELRTPLNSVLGFMRLVLDGACQSPAEEKELLRDAFTSGRHLLGLVNDLLDISRIEAGKLPLQVREIDLQELFASTLPLVSIQAAEKGIELRDETHDVDLPPVRADEVRLRQILLNLLTNAVKFTPQGSVRLRAVVLASAAEDAEAQLLRIEVEDTGVGIPPEQREAVFQRFTQFKGSEDPRFKGAGLGLAISRMLVELMGGKIGIAEGAPGSDGVPRGTLVWFTLPAVGVAVSASGFSE